MKRELHLNLFIHGRGHHEASWRHPASSPLALTDIDYYQDLAQRAEAALFDSIFFADQLALGGDVAQAPRTWLEPITVLAAIAMVTKPGRTDRHRLDHLHRAVQSRSPVRLDRSHQQRPRRLEHRDVLARYRGGELWRKRPGQPCRPLCPRRRIHGGGERGCGTVGRPTPWSMIAPPAFTRSPTASGRSSTAAIFTPWPGPSICRAVPRTTGAGPGRIVRYRPPLRRAACRCRVHGPYGEIHSAGILCRPQKAGGRRGTSARARADPARPQPGDCRHRDRCAAAGT